MVVLVVPNILRDFGRELLHYQGKDTLEGVFRVIECVMGDQIIPSVVIHRGLWEVPYDFLELRFKILDLGKLHGLQQLVNTLKIVIEDCIFITLEESSSL